MKALTLIFFFYQTNSIHNSFMKYVEYSINEYDTHGYHQSNQSIDDEDACITSSFHSLTHQSYCRVVS